MKNFLFQSLFLVALGLIFSACPYTSPVPIDDPKIPVSSSFEGKWIKESELEDEYPKYFEIAASGDFEYNILEYTYSESDSGYTADEYKGHFSNVKGTMFLNMKGGSWTEDYSLYRVDFEGDDKFIFYEVTDNIDEQFNDSKSLRKFIQKNMKNSYFYNKDEETYIKQ